MASQLKSQDPELICDSYTHEKFNSFKSAAFTPVFKSGDMSVQNNYQPISLTSVIGKVLERITRKQVSSFIDKKCCLNSTQHRFRSGWSCLSALLGVSMTSCTCLMVVVLLTWWILTLRRHLTKWTIAFFFIN